jgi:hypothetical protein
VRHKVPSEGVSVRSDFAGGAHLLNETRIVCPDGIHGIARREKAKGPVVAQTASEFEENVHRVDADSDLEMVNLAVVSANTTSQPNIRLTPSPTQWPCTAAMIGNPLAVEQRSAERGRDAALRVFVQCVDVGARREGAVARCLQHSRTGKFAGSLSPVPYGRLLITTVRSSTIRFATKWLPSTWSGAD